MSEGWNDQLLKNPHAVADKRSRVQRMFSAIAPSYDINNRLHSLWMDQRWRRGAVRLAKVVPTDVVVDVACGTGDLTLAMHRAKARQAWATRLPRPTLGVDFTYTMLPLAQVKCGCTVQGRAQRRWDLDAVRAESPDVVPQVERLFAQSGMFFINGDALALPLPDASADVVSIAFGIRNVIDPAAAIREFSRILRPGGRVVVLEFSLPTNPILRGAYNFYFRKVLPRTASLISGDKTGAYKYLPESVNTFIGRAQMMTMMREAGFADVQQFPMTFGVCICYRGYKR